MAESEAGASGPAPEPKPAFLGQYVASAFQEASVVDAYRFRPPYPEAVFEILKALLEGRPRRALDIGCGTGAIARRLAPLVERLDAVDIAPLMVAEGRRLPGGDHPALRWITGAIEDAALDGPYGLVTAAQSLHWMEWDAVMPRLAGVLAPGGRLAIVRERGPALPWNADLQALIRRYSTTRDFQPHDLLDELERRRLFKREGQTQTESWAFTQTIDEYVESFHGRASFSRERMTVEAAAAFDDALGTLVRQHCPDQRVTLAVECDVAWGQPLAPARRRG